MRKPLLALVERPELCYDRDIKKLHPTKNQEKRRRKNEVGAEAHTGGKRPGREAAHGETHKERTMIERTDNHIERYYDSHPTEEDLMGVTSVHAMLIHYLMEVLNWLAHKQVCAVHENLNFYRTAEEGEHPFAPDIAVIKGVLWQQIPSYYIGVDGPAPQVVFEIASKETWKKDLEEKPWLYAHAGIEEYYAYDPHLSLLAQSRSREQRLFGWHRDPNTGLMKALSLRSDGSLWSPRLASSLKPDGIYLRLYDRAGYRRLTRYEASEAKFAAATERAEREAMARQVETERAEREAIARRAETERAERETLRAQEAIRQAEALAEKLRSLGIDPDQ
ncbi:MAG TPA: Uma2 family endonuclease [Ktedonobacteraceae bacterium]|nr:Uma2 family endonuclease [Ktedonobacteraceae bacterium]